jgi:hypothetical protein
MTAETPGQLWLEPIVHWHRDMTAERNHLVTVDLRLADPAQLWPYDEEEFPFTCMLDGADDFSVAAIHDASVLVHRFGGSYGPASFVVTPRETEGERSLWLTIVSPRGIPVRTQELAVHVHSSAANSREEPSATLVLPDAVHEDPAIRASTHAEPESLVTKRTNQTATAKIHSLGQRACIAAEIIASSSSSKQARSEARRELEQAVKRACREVAIDQASWLYEKREETMLAISPEGAAPARIASSFIAALRREVDFANRATGSTDRIRVAVGLSAGLVSADPAGITGPAATQARRLVASAELRDALDRGSAQEFAAIMVDGLHRDINAEADDSFLRAFRSIHLDNLDKEYLGGVWICVPRLADDDYLTGPLFYLSYAHAISRSNANELDLNRRFYEFFDDLSNNVLELVNLPAGTEPGYMDRSLATGTHWTSELLEVVGTCHAFVALLSARYFTSRWCSMEWYAFSQRRVVTLRGEKQRGQSAIVPVLWTPPAKQTPLAVNSIQRFSSAELPSDVMARYESEGIYGLLKTGQDAAYEAVMWRLAIHIAELHYNYRVEPMIFRERELRDIFRDSR